MAEIPLDPVEAIGPMGEQQFIPTAWPQEAISADFKIEYAKKVASAVQGCGRDFSALRDGFEKLNDTIDKPEEKQWGSVLQTSVLTQWAACLALLEEKNQDTSTVLEPPCMAELAAVAVEQLEPSTSSFQEEDEANKATLQIELPEGQQVQEQVTEANAAPEEITFLAQSEGAIVGESQSEGAIVGESQSEGAIVGESQSEGAIVGESQVDRAELEEAIENAFTNFSSEEVKSMQEDFLQRFAKGELTPEENALLAQLQADLPQGDYTMKAKNPNILETKQVHRVVVQNDSSNSSS